MSSFELNELGDGRFALRGVMSFANAESILQASEEPFAARSSIELDLGAVTDADSAGLALMLEWTALLRSRGGEIRFAAVPKSLLAIAKTTEVNELLQLNQSAAGGSSDSSKNSSNISSS